ncbi:hypothetical protein [Methanosphaerula subterraneus]|uniref:hypothetical protein n=1 Tax=Methanosphaerula subterraneus TaxID=3350244 RepID=UPI003F84626E
MVKNPLLKYTVEALLREANPNGEPYFRKTYFFKTLFLLHQALKEKQIDIRLPYCWYLHGPLVEQDTFEDQTGTQLQNYITPANSTMRITNVYDDGIIEKEKQVILIEIRKILKKYKTGPIWHEDYGNKLVGEAYRRAPFTYQRTYKREFLPYFDDLENDSNLYDYAYERISQNLFRYLDSLITQFPERDMNDIFDVYLMWDDTTRLKIENHESINDIKDLSTQYWEIFCSLLRIKQNENVLPRVVDRWEHEFSRAQPSYYHKLESIQDDSLQKNNRGETAILDPEIDTIVRRLMVYARDATTTLPKEM